MKEGYIERTITYQDGKTRKVFIKDLTGVRSGRLVVLSMVAGNCSERIEGSPKRWQWLCKCDCGKEVPVFANNINRNHSTSCGCYNREQLNKSVTTHGLGHTVEYQRWVAMINRCHDQNHKAYNHYHNRNRTVCSRWRYSFEAFLEDIGLRPEGLTLERGDNNEGYHCGKCDECLKKEWKRNGHWDTWKAQGRNKDNNRFFEYKGEKLVANDWADRYGLTRYIIKNRLFSGWSVEKAIQTPIKKYKKNATPKCCD